MSFPTARNLKAANSSTWQQKAVKGSLKAFTHGQHLSTRPEALLRQAQGCRPVSAAHSMSTGGVMAHAASDTTTPAEQLWQTFSQNIAGEWEGATATFGADGLPQALPEDAVPKEYSNWDITLYDWQSQSSMLPTTSGVKHLFKRILPTVGCEADAQTFREESSNLFQDAPRIQHPILDDGSYSTMSSMTLTDAKTLHCEHSFMLSSKKRLRVVQHMRSPAAEQPWQLASIELHNERYDQPYNGGAQLSGCGGGMNNIAEQKRLDASVLQQHWQLKCGSHFTVDSSGSLQGGEATER